ncbi:iron-containing alcohol dehydrogenase [Oceanospirillaceae bacterium]|nr:iron-containing alcohol dehydrogenase [Oceanospirillaceae bacterium]
MSNYINIKSHKGEYTANFIQAGMDALNNDPIENAIYIIDKNVAELYKSRLNNIVNSERVLLIEATERNKSLDKLPVYVNALVDLNVRRGQPIVAIGGGIIQDITCFLASTMMRGLPWRFYPTTLLAQSDSCIGSKSSINSGEVKNILGTFTPPNKVVIDVDFLQTLEQKDIYSGLGEMLKVHAIDAPSSFNNISRNYDDILSNVALMEKFIHDSLLMKKKLIEIDEFDEGPRNVMNYGHSFGHAIESATNYAIPHGIAVTLGMDIANFVAAELGVSSTKHFERMHYVLNKNFNTYRYVNIDLKLMLSALSKDKKNSATQLRLILPDMDGYIQIGLYDNNTELSKAVDKYFEIYGGVD